MQTLPPFLLTKRILAVAGLGFAGYYGGKKLLDTWDWYVDRFYDDKVVDLLASRRFLYGPGMGPLTEPKIELPYEIYEIAERLGRTESHVLHSLERLRRKGKVEPFRNGWRAANSPHQPY